MRRRLVLRAILAVFVLSLSLPAAGAEWDIKSDVLRLSGEAPSLAAFPDFEGIIWLSSRRYLLRPDGDMEKNHRRLIVIAERGGAIPEQLLLENSPGESFEILEASWHDPASGEKNGVLEVLPAGEGERFARVVIPREASGCLVAVETKFVSPKKYYMDDLLVLADELPVWEQRVEVEIPQDIAFYWQGTGVRNPERSVEYGVERIVWKVLNQPVWKSSGLLDGYPPMLVFSLRKGMSLHLSELRDLERSFVAPPLPKEIFSVGSVGSVGLQKIGDRIASYMRDRVTGDDGAYSGRILVRAVEPAGGAPRLSAWEGTLTAAKWLETLGYDVKVFWSQKMPVNQDGPGAKGLWREPVLLIGRDGSPDAYFTAGAADFGKLPPSLYGASVYRMEGAEVRRIVLPRGSASDNLLTQQWKLGIDENGMASGSLDITITGAWANVFSMGNSVTLENAADEILKSISFALPGMSMEPLSVRASGNGMRLAFGVKAPIGIVSGGNILVRMPSGLPVSFAEIPAGGEAFSFRFPFVFEQSTAISVPKGYKAFALPGKTRHGDDRIALDESIVYWEKSGRVDASSKWTVRSAVIDAALTGRISDQLALAVGWSEVTVPIRK
ncbi:MAG: hypothetical protein LBT31_02945 [Synergistaceae bacterium]|jgi:hypothetical protein|nr:hypothetical protein [Synergistaceae bacterium]